MAQSCHALRQFSEEHKDIDKEWFQKSNYLAVLAAKDERSLLKLIEKADSKGIKFSVFFEPDLEYQITAVALEPGIDSKRLCSNFRLALKDKS